MMMWDKRRAVETIMSKRKAGGGLKQFSNAPMAVEHTRDVEGEPDPKHIAAQDVMGAIHEKSGNKLVEALSNFMDLHNIASTKEDPRDLEKV